MMDIAVVTSCWGSYDEYLPEWAQSVAEQDMLPAQAVILDAGVKCRQNLQQAMKVLDAAGIPAVTRRIKYRSLGGARNAAVGAASTEWAMHLDADDLLVPHALADVAEVCEDVDVVSLGAIRNGEPVIFPGITAEQILARKHGMFSCGAFRRSFWEQRPWHTRNDWVDSTFWVGLAHLGARFGSTGRVGFVYRQHADSVSHSLTPFQRRAAMKQWLAACNKWTLN